MLSVKNSGNISADSVVVSISCEDELLTILCDSVFLGSINSGNTLNNNNLRIQTSENTEFGHIFNIEVSIKYNDTIRKENIEIALNGQNCYLP
ncbi:MAG: hypothetical protein HUK15_00195 [Bacteroidales bacterium]|nr:hypothetical protein [Bacteroidales bacterium]